ncbi:MAG: hypothetical protein KC656_04025 [Myxococcales bacterium]|nr:hypothetical protein [Myxococcales bacterium]MCB9671418.1 hypothetical protein [Alphaproteobacteria bacterium]
MALVVWFLLACSGDPGCFEGLLRADDGHCYPPATAPAVEDALLALPCVPVDLEPAIVIRPEGACVHGLCVTDTYAAMTSAVGMPDACGPASTPGYLECDWEAFAVSVAFEDTDGDGALAPNDRAIQVHLAGTGMAATPEGLGPGATPGCATRLLGAPDRADVRTVDGALAPIRMIWNTWGAVIDDDAPRDGLIDEMYFLAP